jgi:signal transduction histidine kinase
VRGDGRAAAVLTQIQLAHAGPQGRVALLFTLPLALRRRAPLAVAVLLAAAGAAQGVIGGSPPSVLGEYLAITLGAYTVGAECPLGPAAAGVLALAAGIVIHDIPSDEYGSFSGVMSDLATPVVLWCVGRAVRLSRGRAARARADADASRELARRAVADERRHIARELHDVVTHSLGIVLLQTQAARRFIDGREPEVSEALGTIDAAGRTAMTEMRRLLGLLRDDDGEPGGRLPQPRLAELPRLVDRVREAGLAVDLRVEGTLSAGAPGIELSAYRIVQEALTNTLRHAQATTAQVLVRQLPSGLEIEVTDDGCARQAGAAGRGLLGMSERAAVLGGTLSHGPRPGGGYRVAAWLPGGAT